MATCFVCGVEIPHGKRYKGDRYKNIPTCSKSCYEELLEIKAGAVRAEPYPDYNDLLSYIKQQWGGNDNVNWMMTAKQVKHLVEKENMTCKQIKKVMEYAITFEGHVVNEEMGLGQFFPRYVEPCRNFVKQIKENKRLAEDMPDEVVVVRKPSKQRRIRKEESWD